MANENQILLYETADGETRLEVLYQDESVWLSQRDMAELLNVTARNISGHIKNIYAEGELPLNPTRKYFFRVQNDLERFGNPEQFDESVIDCDNYWILCHSSN